MSMSVPMVSFRVPVLPWSIAPDDERRLKRIARVVLIGAALVCIVMPWLPVMQPDRTLPQALPPPMAKLILDQALAPPPPPAVKAKAEIAKPVEPREVAANRPDPVKASPRKPDAPAKVATNKEALVPEARVPVPGKPPGEVDAARRRVAGIGLLASKDDLNELHGAPVAVQLAPVKQGPAWAVAWAWGSVPATRRGCRRAH